jgi:hypothetical protein
LDATRQPSGQVVHEMIRRTSVTATDKPARDKFRVRIKCNPSPNTANAGLPPHFFRHVFVFGVTEIPDFIALDALALQVTKNLVLIFRASAANIRQQFQNGVKRNTRHPRRGAKGIALNQAANHFSTFFNAQFIHVHIMLERSSIVNTFSC